MNDLCRYCGSEIFPGEPCGVCKDRKERLHGAKALLELLTVRFPPPKGKNHGILLRTDGEDGLLLLVHVGEKSGQFNLDHDDLNKSVRTLLAELTELIRKNPELST